MTHDIAIIGAGAAGITAGISACRKGASVIICERLPGPGKKILASGNGRCNLSNAVLDSSYYNEEARSITVSVFSRFNQDDIIRFFRGLGLFTYSDDGRIFPVTNQSSSVLKVLELELRRLKVETAAGFEAVDIRSIGSGFRLTAKDGRNVLADSVIITAGGMSYPALGSNGSLYPICERLGHSIIKPAPSAVPLVTKDRMCHLLQGQKIAASVRCMIGGKEASRASGDLLFTKYGLSGTAIIDVSDEASIAINRMKIEDVSVEADMAPFIAKEELELELDSRIKAGPGAEDIIAGILPNKFAIALADILQTGNPASIASEIKAKRFKVSGTRGWNEAEFTAGGVHTDEVSEATLGSKIVKGLYFAGEILNVNGRRGGYNLAWAWASGFVAGSSASGQQ